mgnify:CR=1 FL=1
MDELLSMNGLGIAQNQIIYGNLLRLKFRERSLRWKQLSGNERDPLNGNERVREKFGCLVP